MRSRTASISCNILHSTPSVNDTLAAGVGLPTLHCCRLVSIAQPPTGAANIAHCLCSFACVCVRPPHVVQTSSARCFMLQHRQSKHKCKRERAILKYGTQSAPLPPTMTRFSHRHTLCVRRCRCVCVCIQSYSVHTMRVREIASQTRAQLCVVDVVIGGVSTRRDFNNAELTPLAMMMMRTMVPSTLAHLISARTTAPHVMRLIQIHTCATPHNKLHYYVAFGRNYGGADWKKRRSFSEIIIYRCGLRCVVCRMRRH